MISIHPWIYSLRYLLSGCVFGTVIDTHIVRIYNAILNNVTIITKFFN